MLNGQSPALPTHGARGRPRVRPATPDDLPVLVELWQELRAVGGRTTRETLHITADDAQERLAAALQTPDSRVVVAVTEDDQIHGMAILSEVVLGPMTPGRAVQLNNVVVTARHRKHGVGHALVAAAAAYADEVGADQVIVNVPPNMRDANRFYARLGFTPAVVRRIAPVAVLRRRLSAPEHPVAAMEELTRKRLITRPGRPLRRRLSATTRGNN